MTGIKEKVENIQQYHEYLEELKPLREELGVNLKEDLYPGNTDSPYHNPWAVARVLVLEGMVKAEKSTQQGALAPK
jgi:hypothetical protein